MSSIVIKRADGWYAETTIQDGVERSDRLDDIKSARKWCKLCERLMNGNRIKKRDIPAFEEVEVVVKKLKPLTKGEKR